MDGAATVLLSLSDAAALRRMLHGAVRLLEAGKHVEGAVPPAPTSVGAAAASSGGAAGVMAARSAEVYLISSGAVLDLPGLEMTRVDEHFVHKTGSGDLSMPITDADPDPDADAAQDPPPRSRPSSSSFGLDPTATANE